MDLFVCVDNEWLEQLTCYGNPHSLKGYNEWYYPTSDNQEHMHVLIQLLESCGLTLLADGEWLCYGKEARFHYLVNQPQAAIEAASHQPLVAMTTSAIIPPETTVVQHITVGVQDRLSDWVSSELHLSYAQNLPYSSNYSMPTWTRQYHGCHHYICLAQ